MASNPQITPQQEAALVKAYKDGPDDLQAHGIHVGSEKYMFLRPVDDSFYGKKGVRSAPRYSLPPNGSNAWAHFASLFWPLHLYAYFTLQGDGICVTKSGKAILVGAYKEPILPADANKVVEDMAAYLVSVGF